MTKIIILGGKMKKRYPLHRLINRFSSLQALIICGVGVFLTDLLIEEKPIKIVMIVVLIIFTLIVLWLLIIALRVHDKLEFANNEIIIRSIFQKNQIFNCDAYVCTIGIYISFLKTSEILIFTPKNELKLCTKINTLSMGNCIQANKSKILYCFYDDELLNYLRNNTSFVFIDRTMTINYFV